MVAGAGSGDSDEDMKETANVSRGFANITQDDSENPVLSDKTIHPLSRETTSVMDERGNKAPRLQAEGGVRCVIVGPSLSFDCYEHTSNNITLRSSPCIYVGQPCVERLVC